jgi:hypothetical protein
MSTDGAAAHLDNEAIPTPAATPTLPRWALSGPALGERALQAHREYVAAYLPDRYGPWVGYHGHSLFGFAWTAAELETEARRRMMPVGEYAICRIVPEPPEAPGCLNDEDSPVLPRLDAHGESTLRAYWREQEELIEHEGRWVAYHGERRVGIADSKSALLDACADEALAMDEVLIRKIEFAPTESIGSSDIIIEEMPGDPEAS